MPVYYPRHQVQIVTVLETFDGSATRESDAVSWTCTPRKARLERNDIHTADKLTVEVDFTRFPFDPRLVRTAAVSYWAAGTTGGPVDTTSRDFLRFTGTLDVPETDLGEDALETVLECRDHTALLLGAKAKPTWQMPLDRPLDTLLDDLLLFLPEGQRGVLQLVRSPETDDWPTVSGGGRRGARLTVEPKDTMWSVMRRVVERLGLQIYVDLDQLVVKTPGTTRLVTPFEFGRNLSRLRIKRNNENRTRPVALSAYDPVTRTTTHAQYPPATPTATARGNRGGRGQRSTAVLRTTGHAAVDTEANQAEEFTLRGVYTAAQLGDIAQEAFRQRAYSEVEGSFETHELAVETRDMLSLKTGDLVSIAISSQARALFAGNRDQASRRAFLVREGYPPDVASALARAWDHLNRIDLPMIVRKATTQIDESSFQLDVDFQNMITPLVAAEDGAAVNPGETTVRTRRPGEMTFEDETVLGRPPTT